MAASKLIVILPDVSCTSGSFPNGSVVNDNSFGNKALLTGRKSNDASVNVHTTRTMIQVSRTEWSIDPKFPAAWVEYSPSVPFAANWFDQSFLSLETFLLFFELFCTERRKRSCSAMGWVRYDNSGVHILMHAFLGTPKSFAFFCNQFLQFFSGASTQVQHYKTVRYVSYIQNFKIVKNFTELGLGWLQRVLFLRLGILVFRNTRTCLTDGSRYFNVPHASSRMPGNMVYSIQRPWRIEGYQTGTDGFPTVHSRHLIRYHFTITET